MSKYHILKNNDFYNHHDEDSTATTNVTTSISATTFTDDEENFGLFHRKSNHYQKHNHNNHFNNNDQHQQHHHHFQNSYNNNDENDNDHVLNLHTELLNCDNHVDDLIQYNSNNNLIDANKQSINLYNNRDSSRNIISTTNMSIDKNINIATNTNNLMAPSNFTATTTAEDDYTMDVPLLQQTNNNNNNNIGDRTNNYNNQLHQCDFECVCLCKQKGFAFNLNSSSTRIAKSKILWAIALCCIFMVVEFLGGYIAGSLAIMSDAAHLASDCISFIIGLVAIWWGNKPPDAKMSFGYKRFEVMGAIVSILGIWILTATLVLMAIQRIYSNDYDLDANTMMTISGIGILINIINDKNLNLRAAMIHVIGDLVQSFGVFVASILIKIFPQAVFLDPLCTLLFSVIVIITTINLFKESMHIIMDSVPQGLSINDLEMDLLNIEGVKSVHHMNVWNHTSNYSILMVHLVIDILADSNTVLMNATHLAGSAKYNIKHSTIQIERVT
ncbi:zinc transporter 41F isoform 2-T6 [Cochliomyia hominivorax]